ncbi:MAG: hypothetical protein JWO95_118, partial [Verrucomicrobiales bacterium]|nr:hypothetical protein [Verrucomicrobiales bacterium]
DACGIGRPRREDESNGRNRGCLRVVYAANRLCSRPRRRLAGLPDPQTSGALQKARRRCYRAVSKRHQPSILLLAAVGGTRRRAISDVCAEVEDVAGVRVATGPTVRRHRRLLRIGQTRFGGERMTATRRRSVSLRAFPKLVAVMRELLGNAVPVSGGLRSGTERA